jgi:hypothetical protein
MHPWAPGVFKEAVLAVPVTAPAGHFDRRHALNEVEGLAANQGLRVGETRLNGRFPNVPPDAGGWTAHEASR